MGKLKAGSVFGTLLMAGLLSMGGCNESPDGPPEEKCNPGTTRSCTCPNGEASTMLCYPDGSGFRPCDCPEDPGSGGAAGQSGAAGSGGETDSGTSGDAGATGGSGGAMGGSGGATDGSGGNAEAGLDDATSD